MKMFGTNGIRGIPNQDLDAQKVLKIGMCIGKILGPGPIAIAVDTRISSDMIRSGVSSGIMSMGVNVHNLGLMPTPSLQYYVKMNENVTGGVMITASHNPPEFNGIKCISADGTECSPEEEKAIEDAFDNDFSKAKWDSIGSETTIIGADEDYIDSIVSKIDVKAIKKAKLSVCLDCTNGASVYTSPRILDKLGVKYTILNGKADGMFPGHQSEPIEANLSELKEKVVKYKADLGIAHDGDADRAMFISSSGKFVGGDQSLAILCKHMFGNSKSKEIVTTIASSSVIKDVATQMGGNVTYTAVGSPVVARRMIKDGSVIGGEENGGCIFGDHQFCRDGGMAMARMIEFIAKNGSLDDELNKLPKYHTIKDMGLCDQKYKEQIMKEMIKLHSKEKVNDLDGMRIDYDDGWVLVRPSGTEPKFRIYSESKDEKIAKERVEKLKKEFDEIKRRLS